MRFLVLTTKTPRPEDLKINLHLFRNKDELLGVRQLSYKAKNSTHEVSNRYIDATHGSPLRTRSFCSRPTSNSSNPEDSHKTEMEKSSETTQSSSPQQARSPLSYMPSPTPFTRSNPASSSIPGDSARDPPRNNAIKRPEGAYSSRIPLPSSWIASIRAVVETLAPEEIRKTLLRRMVMLRSGGNSSTSGGSSASSSRAHASGVAALYEGETYDSLRDTIRRLDSSMQYKEYHTLRWSAGFLALLICLMYYFRDELKGWFGTTSADITSRTLGDESVQREAQNLAQGVVYQLLNDAHALRLTTEFLNELLEREHTRRAVLDLLASVAAREETQTLLHNLFVHIMTQPAFVEQTSLFVQDVLARESTKIALRDLFAALFADEEAQQLMADFFQHVINTDTFRDSVYQLGKDTTHDLLNNREISQHAVVWVQDVLGEPDLHSKAGDAIWGAITSTFIPGFLGGGSKKKDMVNIDEAIESLRRDRAEATSQGTMEKNKKSPPSSLGGTSSMPSSSNSTHINTTNSNSSSNTSSSSTVLSSSSISSTTLGGSSVPGDIPDEFRREDIPPPRSKVPPRTVSSAPMSSNFNVNISSSEKTAKLPVLGKSRSDLSQSEVPVFVAAEAAAEAAVGAPSESP